MLVLPYILHPNRIKKAQEYYLNDVVFPAVLRHADAKLSANGQDLGGEASLFPWIMVEARKLEDHY